MRRVSKKPTSICGHNVSKWRSIFIILSLPANSSCVCDRDFHITLTVLWNLKIQNNLAKLWLVLEKLRCLTWNLAKLNKINKIQNMHTIKYHRNDLLNFFVIHYVQSIHNGWCNADNIIRFGIGQNSELVWWQTSAGLWMTLYFHIMDPVTACCYRSSVTATSCMG